MRCSRLCPFSEVVKEKACPDTVGEISKRAIKKNRNWFFITVPLRCDLGAGSKTFLNVIN
jgi:hypothetical protein